MFSRQRPFVHETLEFTASVGRYKEFNPVVGGVCVSYTFFLWNQMVWLVAFQKPAHSPGGFVVVFRGRILPLALLVLIARFHHSLYAFVLVSSIRVSPREWVAGVDLIETLLHVLEVAFRYFKGALIDCVFCLLLLIASPNRIFPFDIAVPLLLLYLLLSERRFVMRLGLRVRQRFAHSLCPRIRLPLRLNLHGHVARVFLAAAKGMIFRLFRRRAGQGLLERVHPRTLLLA